MEKSLSLATAHGRAHGAADAELWKVDAPELAVWKVDSPVELEFIDREERKTVTRPCVLRSPDGSHLGRVRVNNAAGSGTLEVFYSTKLQLVLGDFDRALTTQVEGEAAAGDAIAGVRPVLVAGQDGANIRSLLVDATGRAILGASEQVIGRVGGSLIEGAVDFNAVGGVYAQYDRVSSDGNTTAVTPLPVLFTARKNGATLYIVKLRIQVNKTGLTGIYRLHFYNVAQPTTAIPADNAAFPIKWTNRAERLGHFDLPALSAPGGAGSDISHALDKDLRFPLVCAANDNRIYVALEDRTGMTLDVPNGIYLEGVADEY